MGQPGLTGILLDWYDANRRDLPWRTGPGQNPDPYGVWLSEIMLQQTTVATVAPYYRNFLARWPRLEDLAAAELDDVLHAWQGLGYYARARNLAACSRVLVDDHGGRFPDTKAELRSLPGIGDYTASAIAAIAFGRREAAVDGNVVRVLSRLAALAEPMPGLRKKIVRLAEPLVPSGRPGDFAQALMDLGATVCVPRGPRCGICPWREQCAGHGMGNPEAYPVKVKKAEKPTRFGVAFWATDNDGSVLIRKRPVKGLLGGMMEIPSTVWRADPWTLDEAIEHGPVPAQWTALPGEVRHTFTHFHLRLGLLAGRVGEKDIGGLWCPPNRFGHYALPTVMKKIVRCALNPKQKRN